MLEVCIAGGNDSRVSHRIKALCQENVDLKAKSDFLEKQLYWVYQQRAYGYRAREDYWLNRTCELEQHIGALEKRVVALEEQLSRSKATVVKLQKQLFGPTTEKSPPPQMSVESAGTKVLRKRGKQPGTKGYGRILRENLEVLEKIHELPLNARCCRQCGKEYVKLPWTKDSTQIDIETKVFLLLHKRRTYRRACRCIGQPKIIAAGSPPKLIRKGLFTPRFVAEVLIEKFLLQRPLNRVLKNLWLYGLKLSSGTIVGSLKQLWKHKMFKQMDECVKERNRCSPHWNLDETSWKVFEDTEGKKGHRWWLWVSASKDTAVYIMDPHRAGRVPEEHFASVSQGIAICDRLNAYACLKKKFKLAYCWAHARRDFIDIRNGHPEAAPQAQSWVERINDLFEQNTKRCGFAKDTVEFAKEDTKLKALLAAMEQAMLNELADPTLHPELAAALTRLKKHWAGHMVFVEHSEIPMDNNEAERKLRNPVVGRKNYYGSGSKWMAELSAQMFTVLTTIEMNGLDVRKWLTEYLEACAENGGDPPDDVESWLPWNMSPERKEHFAKKAVSRRR